MGLFSGSKWGKALKEKIEAKKERETARTEKADARKSLVSKKKGARKDKRAAVKKVRSEHKPGKTRRMMVGATKAFHGTDKEGNKGGFAAFGKYSQKQSAKAKKIADRKTKVADRQAARKAKRDAR